MTTNQLKYWENRYNKFHNAQVRQETERANRAQEREANRANLARERENERANREKEANARFVAKQNDLHTAQNYLEQVRHNAATEAASVYSNETDRQKVGLGYYQSDKSAQVGLANAGAAYANIAANERIQNARQAEINRSNLINEGFTAARVANEQAGTRIKAIEASTGEYDAATKRQQLGLESQKWRSMLQPESEAKTNLMYQQALTEKTKRGKTYADTALSGINMGLTIGGLITKKMQGGLN